jgi:tetratricopeptide (TPR) repeat protein
MTHWFRFTTCCAWPLAAGLVLLAAGCSRDPQAVKTAALKKADAYAQQGKRAEAVIEYRNAAQADPQDGEVLLKLADAYSAAGDHASAIREYLRASDLLTQRVDVQLKAGNLLLLGRRFDDAKVRAEKALVIAPQDVEAHILLANSLAGLKQFDAAIEEVEDAIRTAPERGSSYATLGALEAGRGRMAAAETAFKKATELDDRSIPAHLALANFYWIQRRWPDAEAQLRKALDLDPNHVVTNRALAAFSLALNRPADAEKYLKTVVEVTKAPEATLALADFYMARGGDASARAMLQTLPSSGSAGPQVAVRLAALDHAAGRSDEAYKTLDGVLSSDRGNLQALLAKSTMLLQDKRLDDALAAAKTATESHGQSAAAFFVLGRIQTARNDTDGATTAYREALRLNPRATGVQLALAQIHLATGRTAESVGFAEDAVRSDPSNPNARLALVRGLLARGDLQRAERELAQLVAAAPNSAAVRVQNGILHARKKNPAAARREFEQALAADPSSIEAIGGLAALDLAAKQPEAARARVGARANQPDATPPMMMVAARTYIATGDLAGAEQMLRRILQKDPSYLHAYGALGEIYVRRGQLDAALTEFDAMTKRHPKPVAALTLTGMILQSQGKVADARSRFERVLQIDPTAPVAANNLAWMLAESGGNLDVALQLAQTAARGLPDSPEVSDTLGFVYFKKDLLPQAIQTFRSTIEKDPTKPEYHFHLGQALAKAGDQAGARQHLTEALRLKSDFPEAAAARSLLETLGSPQS